MQSKKFVSPSEQRFESPTDIRAACALLAQAEGRVAVLAGGTDLMPRFNTRKPAIRPNLLLFLGKLGLGYIRVEGQTLIIGACTTHDAIANSPAVQKHAPLLGKTCSEIASPAIRNAATIGGNVCNAAPWADGVTALLALDASVVIAAAAGDRVMKIAEFVEGPSKVALRRGEIVKEFHVPVMTAGQKWAWRKQGQRKASVISVASVAVSMNLNDGNCRNVRIAVGAVARIPYVSKAAAALLEGRPLTERLAAEAGAAVAAEVTPREDSRASSWYKKKYLTVIVKRLLGEFI
jgi:carbon-monoxide dehydrogenase medium subunit